LAVEGLTSSSVEHKLNVLEVLENTDADTGKMHEAFNVEDPTEFTRSWFSWADMTYVELVLQSVDYKAQ
jgi:meiotically up-regulated gene 157 (Mug157) protein